MRSSVLIKTLGIPGFLGIIVILMYVFAGQFIYKKVIEVKDKQEQVKVEETALKLKLATLKDTQTTVDAYAQGTVLALPQSNPTLIAFSQIKNISLENQVVLSNVNVGAEIKDASISRVIMSFDADGETRSIVSFIRAIANVAPLTRLEKVKIASSGTSSRATISVSFHWSALPKQISAVDEGIKVLSDSEQDTLKIINGLRRPEFSEIIEGGVEVSSGRVNPFSSGQ